MKVHWGTGSQFPKHISVQGLGRSAYLGRIELLASPKQQPQGHLHVDT